MYILTLNLTAMKKSIIIAAIVNCMAISSFAQEFGKHFADSTLRLDYIFGGKVSSDGKPECQVLLDGLVRTTGWSGRRNNLVSMPLAGNGRVTVRDKESGDTIYVTTFSTLFQEWLAMPESREVARSFENSFLVPMPRRLVTIDVELYDSNRKKVVEMSHNVNPSDILIVDRSNVNPNPHRYIHRSTHPERAIDVAILSEGYSVAEMDSFYKAAEIAVDAILSHEPFRSRADEFNFVAVGVPSSDSGVSVPRLGEWKSTAAGSNFSTFYSDRYLTTRNVKRVHDCLINVPYEHIIILANTTEYGGGGIYNFYTLTTAGHASFRPVVVHEFGHSFGGLADEYFYSYDDPAAGLYHKGVEPWEQNITTLTDFDSKWKDMLPPGVRIPTSPAESSSYPVGVYEGGGYQSRGVFRPANDCRMRTNTSPAFCPVCIRAIDRLIDFYVK